MSDALKEIGTEILVRAAVTVTIVAVFGAAGYFSNKIMEKSNRAKS